MKKNDTLVLLKVNEKGIDSINGPPNGWIVSQINAMYIDTAIISSDLIYSAPGYRCPVFPFWKLHTIDSNSLSKYSILALDTVLKKGISGSDTLFFVVGPMMSIPLGKFVYIQGIGLDSLSITNYSGNTHSSTQISLISYNNKEISFATPVVSKLPSKNVSENNTSLFNTSKALILKTGIKLLRDVFLVNGKRIMSGEIVPNEAIIQNKAQHANVKNR